MLPLHHPYCVGRQERDHVAGSPGRLTDSSGNVTDFLLSDYGTQIREPLPDVSIASYACVTTKSCATFVIALRVGPGPAVVLLIYERKPDEPGFPFLIAIERFEIAPRELIAGGRVETMAGAAEFRPLP